MLEKEKSMVQERPNLELENEIRRHTQWICLELEEKKKKAYTMNLFGT